MKKPLILISCMLTLSVTHAGTININFNDWCPHYCSATGKPDAPSNTYSGYQLDIIKRIFGQNENRIEYLSLPWGRAIKEAANGRLDALLSPSKREAPELLFPKEEIGVIEWCFYTKISSSWSYTGTSSLNRVMLGFLQGNYFSSEVQHILKTTKTSQC